MNCFARDFSYHDGQYLGSFINQSELQRHLSSQAQLLPQGCQMVVDHMAVDVVRRHVATQWHVQRSKTTRDKVPLTNGISFYTLTKDGTKIANGRRVSEMWIKPPPAVASALTTWASVFMGTKNNQTPIQSTGRATKSSLSSKSSIIEEYFDAWNRRDMEAALACFVDDCRYQTEDPVFVDAFCGKAALRAHLEKNAASLPGSARIILDDLAIDDTDGKIGTTWHLQIMEENVKLLPTLRGCSMYTTDPTTGLLVTGYDVTEAPAKLPQASTVWLAGPARWLFNRRL